jgi:anion-transporting  ArsA/GET3 family ATPase
MKDPSRQNFSPHLLESLIDSEFLFVTGKGGVGKSSVTALVGQAAASRGKRCLLVYPGESASAERLWGRTLRDEPEPVAERLAAVRIQPETAMREYVADALGSTKVAAVLFHHRVAKGLLTGIPGPSDWAILGKAWSYTKTGVRARGSTQRPYDLVILDAPASGDAAGMLRVPQVIMDLAPAARLRSDAESCLHMLRDPRRSRVIFVTLLEHLALSETEETLEVVRQELRMPVGPVFVNRILPDRFSQDDREFILSLPSPQLPATLDTKKAEDRALITLHASVLRATREHLQENYLERIRKWGEKTLRLPLIPEGLHAEGGFQKLQMALAEGR